MAIHLNTNLMTLAQELVEVYCELKIQKRGASRRLQRLMTRYSCRNHSHYGLVFHIANIPVGMYDTCLQREDYEKLGEIICQNNSAQVSFQYVESFYGNIGIKLMMVVDDPKDQTSAQKAVWADLVATVLERLMEHRNHHKQYLLDGDEKVGNEYLPVEQVFHVLKDFVAAYHPTQLVTK
jgi:hypothetical protein